MATTIGPRARACLFAIGAAVVAAVVLVPAAQARFVDGDEGFYLLAARLVAGGRRLYADFFFPQMPLVPQAYGAWFALAGAGWRAGRLLSSLFAIATGLLLAAEARRRTQHWGWGAAALGLYLTSGLVLGWFTVAKTYALAALLLVAGATVLQRLSRKATFFGALLLALAAATRLYLVVALPCAWLFLWRAHPGARMRRLSIAAAGALAALLPILPSLLRDRHAFYFGAVAFHVLRDPAAAHVGQLGPKWWLLLSALSLKGNEGPGAVQLLGLVVAAVAAALSPLTPRNQPTTYLWIALVPASLVPTPAYPQYFCLLVPLLILDAVALLSTVPLRRAAPWLLPAGLAYASLGVFDGDRYLRTGAQVPGVEVAERSARWTIPTLARAAAEIDAQGMPVALSWWPGYFVSTRTALAPELANDFGLTIADQLPAAERQRLHLVTHDELSGWIATQRLPLVVAGNWTTSSDGALLPRAGYRQVARLENVGIWVSRGSR